MINDFSVAIKTIQNIITQPEFLTNHNDQSLVEICITRLVSAIRETRTIEAHAADLVALLENCLSYNLRPSAARGGGLGLDPPHAKIAGDVMSCIFLNYSKRGVMELALPVAVKFLHKGNKDLSRNMSSYLSLAAIENAGLLARHIQPIIDSVISGNYSLSRVLPTIYAAATDEDRNRGGHSTINNHVMTLVSILPNCENTEKLALLSLFSLVAKENSALLEPSVPQLCESLTQQSTALSTLQVLHNMALVKPSILADHLEQVKEAAENFPKTTMSAVQVMCAVAKVRPDKAEETMDFILASICLLESEKHSIVLKEIVALVNRCPELLSARVVNKVSSLEEGASSAARSYIQELKNDFNSRQSSSSFSLSREEMLRSSLMTDVAGVTVVRVGGGTSGSRTELSSSKPHLFQQMTPNKVENRGIGQATSGSRTKLDNKSGVSRVIPTGHRSMTKLNMSAAAAAAVTAPTATGVNKSMTRINASSQQNMARFSSSGQAMNSSASGVMSVAPYGVQSGHHGGGGGGGAHGAVARSVTCISGASLAPGHGSRSRVISSYGPRVSVNNVGGPGASSPTKSMSSGSMSGVASGGGVVGIGPTLVPSEPNVAAAASGGREVLTVNVNQINQDLIRQVSTVLSQHGGDINGLLPPSSSTGASYSHIAASAQVTGVAYPGNTGPAGGGGPLMGSGSAAAAAAPLSLPSQASRRVAPYSSGPLPTLSASQPPSLGLPNAQQHNQSRDFGAQNYVQQHHQHHQHHHHHQQPHSDAVPSSTSPRRPFSSSTLPSPRRRAAMEKRLKANSNNKADANADVDGNEVDDDEDNNRGLSGSADDVITRGENTNAGNSNVCISTT